MIEKTMTSSYKMEGKVAIVTGSSSGIGEAIALMLARSGACVTICGRNRARLERVKAKCQQAAIDDNGDGGKGSTSSMSRSSRFLIVQGDLNDQSVRCKTVEDTVSRFGRLDMLVANAGEVNIMTTFQDETEEGFDKCFDSFVKAPVFLLQQAVPHLEKSRGSVVIVSSPSSTCVLSSQFPYCTSKAAVDALMTIMAFQLGPKGVRVNAIRPGWVSTNITRDFCKEDAEQLDNLNGMFAEAMRGTSVLDGRLSTADEQAEVACYLLSGGASFVTGVAVLTDASSSRLCPSINK